MRLPDLEELRNFVVLQLFEIIHLLHHDRQRAKQELRRHIDELTMMPTTDRDGKKFYVGEGKFDLLGEESGEIEVRKLDLRTASIRGNNANFGEGRAADSEGNTPNVRVVAGGGFEPPTFGL